MVVRLWQHINYRRGVRGDVKLLAYADDILLIAARQSDMVIAVDHFEEALQAYDLSFDPLKCQLLSTHRKIVPELQRFPDVKARKKEEGKENHAVFLSHLGVRISTTPRKTILANIQALSHLGKVRGLLYHFDISDRLWITLVFTLSKVLYTFTPLA